MWNPFRKIIYHSPINGDIVLGRQNNEKAIFAGGVTQSGGELVIMWDTLLKDLYKKKVKVKHFLLLGVGAGMIFRIVRKYYPKAILTGIEIDPVMKNIAIQEFAWKDTKSQKIIVTDVFDWLNTTITNKFDLIAVDLFIGKLNTPNTRNKVFLKKLKKVMLKNGTILYNAHYQEINKEQYTIFRKMTDTVFENVQEVFSYPLNRVLRFTH